MRTWIALAALADEMRGAGAAAIDIELQVLGGDLHPRRTAVHDAAHGGAVALAERRDREQLAYRVTGHVLGSPYVLLRIASGLPQLFRREQENTAAATLEFQPSERQMPVGASDCRRGVAHFDDQNPARTQVAARVP